MTCDVKEHSHSQYNACYSVGHVVMMVTLFAILESMSSCLMSVIFYLNEKKSVLIKMSLSKQLKDTKTDSQTNANRVYNQVIFLCSKRKTNNSHFNESHHNII